MATGQLKIHSENILPIIKKWLYSEKDIFVRELVSNSCDALQKVKILQDRGDLQNPSSSPRIEIKQDKDAMTLTFSDTGIGMDADEVEKYLAQIAFSGAEEFVKAYEAHDQFIGHFGLGFYSAYMVADKVEVHTLSQKKDAKAVLWSCDGTSSYEITEGSRTTPGTDIILHINKENEEYLVPARLQSILKRNCAFLPYPIFFNDTLINDTEPLWVKTPSECTKDDYLNFFKTLYPYEQEPLFWVHLNVDYPFHVKGILYFPHIGKDFDFQKSQVKLFCNRVFVSDDCKDILPDYLSMLRGAIDSPDIPLNVSRSYLQVDATVRLLANHISKKVADALTQLYKQDRERFLSAWPDCEIIVKFGALQDEKFYQKAKDILIWKTTKNSWMTTEEYLEKHKETSKETIFYVATDHPDSHLLAMYEDKGYDVLIAPGRIDAALMAFLERELKTVRFRRIDAEIDHHILDTEKEKTVLGADGRTEAAKIADFARASVSKELEVEAKSLASSAIPAFIAISEEERRFREYMLRMAPESTETLPTKMKFVLNTNSSLINAIYELSSHEEELAKLMMREVYDLSLLSQKEMDPKTVNDFIKRSQTLLEKLCLQIKK